VQARDLDIDAKPRSDQATRFAFQKLTVEQTKARAGESLTRVVGSVADYSNKKYWTQAQNEVRNDTAGQPSLAGRCRGPPRTRARCAPAQTPPRPLATTATRHAAQLPREHALTRSTAPALLPLVRARSCAARSARCASTWTTWWRPRAAAPPRLTS
jgi:hypothetical protein